MVWRCLNCKRNIDGLDLTKVGMKCPFCKGKIFYKERTMMPKRIKAK